MLNWAGLCVSRRVAIHIHTRPAISLPALLKPPAVARLQPADYPTESPKVVQGLIHKGSLQMLEDSLRAHLTYQFPHLAFQVTGDVYVHPVGASNLAPDVIVYLQRPDMQGRDSFNIEEHGAPDLVIEVLSSVTWPEDIQTKKGHYAAMGIAECWVHDPERLQPAGTPIVQGFRLKGNRYGAIAPYPSVVEGQDVGLYHSAVLQTEWGADARRAMRLYNPATGRWYADLQSKREAIRGRLADKDKEIERLRALLRQYGIDPDANVP